MIFNNIKGFFGICVNIGIMVSCKCVGEILYYDYWIFGCFLKDVVENLIKFVKVDKVDVLV